MNQIIKQGAEKSLGEKDSSPQDFEAMSTEFTSLITELDGVEMRAVLVMLATLASGASHEEAVFESNQVLIVAGRKPVPLI